MGIFISNGFPEEWNDRTGQRQISLAQALRQARVDRAGKGDVGRPACAGLPRSTKKYKTVKYIKKESDKTWKKNG